MVACQQLRHAAKSMTSEQLGRSAASHGFPHWRSRLRSEAAFHSNTSPVAAVGAGSTVSAPPTAPCAMSSRSATNLLHRPLVRGPLNSGNAPSKTVTRVASSSGPAGRGRRGCWTASLIFRQQLFRRPDPVDIVMDDAADVLHLLPIFNRAALLVGSRGSRRDGPGCSHGDPSCTACCSSQRHAQEARRLQHL